MQVEVDREKTRDPEVKFMDQVQQNKEGPSRTTFQGEMERGEVGLAGSRGDGERGR